MPTDNREIIDALADVEGVRLGDNVIVYDGEWSPRGRHDDGSPHYGGAAIGSISSQYCTAGFAMTNDGVHKYMVTAGHCTEPPTTFWYSGGSKYWGATQSNYWPGDDIRVIGSGSQQYSRVIHTGPSSPTTRLANSKANASTSYTNICNSGKATGAICGIAVQSFTGSISCGGHSFSSSTTSYGTRPGYTIGQAGDSGSPVYYRNGSTTARILGMHTCGRVPFEILFIKPSHLESVTGMSVSTACCNATSW